MARLSFRCVPELVERVDLARGGVPREAWLRGAVERALASPPLQEGESAPAPAEQPVLSRADAFRRATQRR